MGPWIGKRSEFRFVRQPRNQSSAFFNTGRAARATPQRHLGLGALMLSSRKIDLKEETRRSSVRKKGNLKTSEMNNTKSVEISTDIECSHLVTTPQYHLPICGAMQLPPSYCFEPLGIWYDTKNIYCKELNYEWAKSCL